jgi:cation diffusion facilitator family transporter
MNKTNEQSRGDPFTQRITERLARLFMRGQTPPTRAAYGKLAGTTGIICNLLLAASKLAAGLLSGSIAFLGDAVNNLSDAAASGVTLAGFVTAEKPADKEHPFGHARFEYIAGLVTAVLILVIGIETARSSVERILAPTPTEYGALSLCLLAVSIPVKLGLAAFSRVLGRRIESQALETAFADSRNDVLTTSVILLSALTARFTGRQLDGWMGLAVSAFIIFSGAGLVKKTLNPLLGAAPSAELVSRINEKIRAYPGVLDTHDLMVHDYGPDRRFASAHVEMSAEQDPIAAHETIDLIERDFLLREGIHMVLHHDPLLIGSGDDREARVWVARQARQIDERLTIHDLRAVEDADRVSYIFDIVTPPDFALSESELQRRIQDLVQRGEKPIHAIITVDHGFAPMQR